MIAIDNPTEAAAMQMMASRKLIVFFSKIVARVLDEKPALSAIPLAHPGRFSGLIQQSANALLEAFTTAQTGISLTSRVLDWMADCRCAPESCQSGLISALKSDTSLVVVVAPRCIRPPSAAMNKSC
jgi:hypothetical protein